MCNWEFWFSFIFTGTLPTNLPFHCYDMLKKLSSFTWNLSLITNFTYVLCVSKLPILTDDRPLRAAYPIPSHPLPHSTKTNTATVCLDLSGDCFCTNWHPDNSLSTLIEFKAINYLFCWCHPFLIHSWGMNREKSISYKQTYKLHFLKPWKLKGLRRLYRFLTISALAAVHVPHAIC